MNATTKTTNSRTPGQNKVFHSLCNQLKLDTDTKAVIAYQFSVGRTEHTSELTKDEMREVIETLEQQIADNNDKIASRKQPATRNQPTDFERGDRMRKRILSMCYENGWTVYNGAKGKHVVDMDHLNEWMVKYSYLHKPLNSYTYNELGPLVTQFEKLNT